MYIQKTNTLLFIFFAVLVSSCLRLDSNLFNNDNSITEYKLDAYEGDNDFKLDDSYKIDSKYVSQFTLESKGKGDKKPVTIYAIYIGDQDRIKTDTIIMYCHGNKDHMDKYWQRAKLLANTGTKNRFGVMMVDYRGFGLSKGKPTEEGMYADIDAALKWLKSKGLTNNRLIMYGFSVGSAPAVELTRTPRSMTPLKLMLEAPFASSQAMVQDASKTSYKSSYFTDIRVDNAEKIQKISQPLFWMHGEEDDFVAMRTHGQVVYDNYHGTYQEAHKIPGAGHSDIEEIVGFKEYLKLAEAFIIKR